MKELAGLINGKFVSDITGKVQTIVMTDRETGQVYRGNGIVIYRPNHIHGNAPVFLSRNGCNYEFGGKLISYTFNEKFKSWDYSKMDIECDMKNDAMIDRKYAQDNCII